MTTVWRLRAHGDKVFTPTSAPTAGSWPPRATTSSTREDGVVRLWALPAVEPVGAPLRYRTVGDLSLSPDGRTLAVTHPPSGGVEIVDVASRRRRTSLTAARTAWDIARFTPDGRFLVGGSWKGLDTVMEHRDVDAGQPPPHRPRWTCDLAVPPAPTDRRSPPGARTARSASGTCRPSSRSAPRCPACPTARSLPCDEPN
jgi:hypothetical protein